MKPLKRTLQNPWVGPTLAKLQRLNYGSYIGPRNGAWEYRL